jgi:hypothetical protein
MGALIGCVTVCALLLVPASASACPTKRHVVRHGHTTVVEKTCTDSFKQPAPCPGAGQSVTLWADEGISKDAQAVKPSLRFPGGGCPNATVTGVTYKTGATADPDGSPTKPKPGEQIEQVVWTEDGTGPGGQTPDVQVVVTYQDPSIKPVEIQKWAALKLGETAPHFSQLLTDVTFYYVIDIHNPNSRVALVHIRDRLIPQFAIEHTPQAQLGDHCRLDGRIVECDVGVAPGKDKTVVIKGAFKEPGTWVNVATAIATLDRVTLPEVRTELTLRVKAR